MVSQVLKKSLFAILALAVVCVLLAPWGMYFFGLQAIPHDTSPSHWTAPRIAQTALWIDLEGNEAEAMEAASPYTFVVAIGTAAMTSNYVLPKGFNVANQAARTLFIHRQRETRRTTTTQYQLQTAALAIWISRNWTAEQALSTLLAEGYLGRQVWGLSSAAQTYFGRSLAELENEEVILLVSLLKSPSYYDPWCRSERTARRLRMLQEKLVAASIDAGQISEGELPAGLLPAPEGACSRH